MSAPLITVVIWLLSAVGWLSGALLWAASGHWPLAVASSVAALVSAAMVVLQFEDRR